MTEENNYLKNRQEQKLNGKPEKKKKIYNLKRTPIKKKFYRIKKVSEKREKENQEYFPKRDKFLKSGDGRCQLKIPGVCTTVATCVHHVAGRTGKMFLDKKFWKRSCHPCNGWVEDHDAEARKLKLKSTRLGKSEKRPVVAKIEPE